MADTGQQLIEAAVAAAERRALELVEQARARREREREQRAQLAAARNRGIGKRHAAKLRHQASRGDTPTVAADDVTSQTPIRVCERDRCAGQDRCTRAGGSENEGARS